MSEDDQFRTAMNFVTAFDEIVDSAKARHGEEFSDRLRTVICIVCEAAQIEAMAGVALLAGNAPREARKQTMTRTSELIVSIAGNAGWLAQRGMSDEERASLRGYLPTLALRAVETVRAVVFPQ